MMVPRRSGALEASQFVRIALTGSTRSPNLHQVARTLGVDEVLRRLRAVR